MATAYRLQCTAIGMFHSRMFHPYTQLNGVAQTFCPCIWDINASNPGLVITCSEEYICGLEERFHVNSRITLL